MGIKEYILKNTILKRRLKLLDEKKELYKNIYSSEKIYEYQLSRFNEIWQKVYKEIPFYKMWKEKNNLPDNIKSIEELKSFPLLTKKDIQQNSECIFGYLKGYSTISTGGSTGEPTKFPFKKMEIEDNYATNYLARSWWGFEPLDKVLLFWGHSHLFGSGVKGKINQYKRVISDWLINTKRLNAYDTSFNTLVKYVKELNSFKPKFIVGYTSVIYKLAKYIKENDLKVNSENLKGVIVTSETATKSDVELIEDVFNVPCIIEYGMAETGIIAYRSKKSNTIALMWDSILGIQKEKSLVVTTLHNKLFPLINYQTDDLIITHDIESILNIDFIAGRNKDILKVATQNGLLELSGILMVHVLKGFKGIYDIQFIQLEKNKVKILFTVEIDIDNSKVKKYFLDNIKQDHLDILEDSFEFVQVEEVEKTIAGKIKLISGEL